MDAAAFWALALVKSGDYARAGIPMMPNVATAGHATRRQIVLYSLIMAPVAVLPALMGFGGLLISRSRSRPASS